MNNATQPLNRREFLRTSGGAGAALATFSLLPAVRGAESPSNKVVVGVIGTSRNSVGGDGRGTELAVWAGELPGIEIAWVCDVDERNVPKAVESVSKKCGRPQSPKGERDLRRVLEDKAVDAVIIATPDHWHAPAAILACAAGKHVYVEKPCSHNPGEGELLVQASRQHRRHVQQGTQRRSWPVLIEAVAKLRSGIIGRVLFAQCWYFNPRPTIGKGKAVPVPSWLDYDLWQGPAPLRPYRDNILHYNWHWFWHWGTGELGNNAVHYLDVIRWGLGVDLPLKVTCSGGKYGYPSDDQETPDTCIASFDFGQATATWEQRSWGPRTVADPKIEMAFYGDKGVLTISGGGYVISDPKGTELAKGSGNAGTEVHLQNFFDAVREKGRLNAEIEEGNKSTLLCHLGNIAWRTGHTIHCDPATGRIKNDPAADALWAREYRPGWEPKV
jgi:predicted dehydrogenase